MLRNVISNLTSSSDTDKQIEFLVLPILFVNQKKILSERLWKTHDKTTIKIHKGKPLRRIYLKPFNILLICLLFYGTKTEAVSYAVQNGPTVFQFQYQMDDYLRFKMTEIRSTMRAFWKKPLHKISLQDILKKSEQGDQTSKLFLIYLYLGKWLKQRYPDYYFPHFKDIKVTQEGMESIRNLFQKMPLPYEWDFIEGWIALFLAKSTLHPQNENASYLKKSFSHFLRAKSGNYREFKLQWAFLVTEMEEPFTGPKTLKEAKDTILILSESDYPYAQYLQGFLALQDNELHTALHWFRKSHKNNFMRKECTILIGLLYLYFEDFPRATPYLNEAVHGYHIESLKPKLMAAYTQQNKKDTALKLAREIAENYTKFPLDAGLTSMEYLSLSLFKGEVIERNLKESYTWLERASRIAEANNTPFTSNHLPALKTQLSQKKQQEARRRALFLYWPARQYSKMEEIHPCYQIFH